MDVIINKRTKSKTFRAEGYTPELRNIHVFTDKGEYTFRADTLNKELRLLKALTKTEITVKPEKIAYEGGVLNAAIKTVEKYENKNGNS